MGEKSVAATKEDGRWVVTDEISGSVKFEVK
jgi:hypothetical protein